jgi:hypothetical protein
MWVRSVKKTSSVSTMCGAKSWSPKKVRVRVREGGGGGREGREGGTEKKGRRKGGREGGSETWSPKCTLVPKPVYMSKYTTLYGANPARPETQRPAVHL